MSMIHSRFIKYSSLATIIALFVAFSCVSNPDEIQSFADIDVKPKVLNSVTPNYPLAAEKDSIQGTVYVKIVIDKNGIVENAEIIKSILGLNEAALEAARKLTFSPGQKDGNPVKTEMIFPFRFDLDKVIEFFDVSVKPKLIHKATPEYPEELRKSGVEGTVVVIATIGRNGDVEHVEHYKLGPELDKRLVEVAMKAAMKCKFKPAQKDGKLVKVKMSIPFKFRIR